MYGTEWVVVGINLHLGCSSKCKQDVKLNSDAFQRRRNFTYGSRDYHALTDELCRKSKIAQNKVYQTRKIKVCKLYNRSLGWQFRTLIEDDLRKKRKRFCSFSVCMCSNLRNIASAINIHTTTNTPFLLLVHFRAKNRRGVFASIAYGDRFKHTHTFTLRYIQNIA